MHVSREITGYATLSSPAVDVSPPLVRDQKVVNILFVADYLITRNGR